MRPVLFTVHAHGNTQGDENHQELGGPHPESAWRTRVPLANTTGHGSDVTAKTTREAERSQNDAAANK